MIEIKEQGHGLQGCIQKVKTKLGIVYPDVSSCLTFTAILDDEFGAAHISMGNNPVAGPNDFNFIKKRFDTLTGEAKKAKNCFVIGWYGMWNATEGLKNKRDALVKILQSKSSEETIWLGDFHEGAPGDATSSDITFLPNGDIQIVFKNSGKQKGSTGLNWRQPKEKDKWFKKI